MCVYDHTHAHTHTHEHALRCVLNQITPGVNTVEPRLKDGVREGAVMGNPLLCDEDAAGKRGGGSGHIGI